MEPQGQATSPCSTSEHRKCGWRVLEQGPTHSTPQHHSCLGFQILGSRNRMCHSPETTGLIPKQAPSAPWDGQALQERWASQAPLPGLALNQVVSFLLGLLLIPSMSLKACLPPSAPPWPVQPPLRRTAACRRLACTNAKLHTRASA